MQFDRKIYDYNWRILARWLVPLRLRNPKLLALATAISSAIAYVHSRFVVFKDNAAYRLTITPQVCYLERALNDRFDRELRRIYITNASYSKVQYIYLNDEKKPLELYRVAEDKPLRLLLNSETGAGAADFIVHAPASLNFSVREMTAVLDSYKLATKKYNVNIVI